MRGRRPAVGSAKLPLTLAAADHGCARHGSGIHDLARKRGWREPDQRLRDHSREGAFAQAPDKHRNLELLLHLHLR
jgi:hypothetical protein